MTQQRHSLLKQLKDLEAAKEASSLSDFERTRKCQVVSKLKKSYFIGRNLLEEKIYGALAQGE